jgi:hypothetical protein
VLEIVDGFGSALRASTIEWNVSLTHLAEARTRVPCSGVVPFGVRGTGEKKSRMLGFFFCGFIFKTCTQPYCVEIVGVMLMLGAIRKWLEQLCASSPVASSALSRAASLKTPRHACAPASFTGCIGVLGRTLPDTCNNNNIMHFLKHLGDGSPGSDFAQHRLMF